MADTAVARQPSTPSHNPGAFRNISQAPKTKSKLAAASTPAIPKPRREDLPQEDDISSTDGPSQDLRDENGLYPDPRTLIEATNPEENMPQSHRKIISQAKAAQTSSTFAPGAGTGANARASTRATPDVTSSASAASDNIPLDRESKCFLPNGVYKLTVRENKSELPAFNSASEVPRVFATDMTLQHERLMGSVFSEKAGNIVSSICKKRKRKSDDDDDDNEQPKAKRLRRWVKDAKGNLVQEYNLTAFEELWNRETVNVKRRSVTWQDVMTALGKEEIVGNRMGETLLTYGHIQKSEGSDLSVEQLRKIRRERAEAKREQKKLKGKSKSKSKSGKSKGKGKSKSVNSNKKSKKAPRKRPPKPTEEPSDEENEEVPGDNAANSGSSSGTPISQSEESTPSSPLSSEEGSSSEQQSGEDGTGSSLSSGYSSSTSSAPSTSSGSAKSHSSNGTHQPQIQKGKGKSAAAAAASSIQTPKSGPKSTFRHPSQSKGTKPK